MTTTAYSGATIMAEALGGSETERLVARIDADIRKLQEWRAYVLGQSPMHPADDNAPPVRRKRGPKPKKGLPAQNGGL